MSRTLDITAKKRPTIAITLPRRRRFFSRKQRLDVYTPTKSTRELFTFLGESLIKISDGSATENDFDLLYDVTARILSRNKQGVELSANDLEKILETEDVIVILKAYAEFLTGEVESKN